MTLDFSQNGLKVVFEVTEQQTLVLKEFYVPSYEPQPKGTLKWSSVSDVHITGGNHNDHHGGKHTGTSESFTLKYEDHKYYENEYGNKLEFYLRNDKVAVTQHYQFYKGISAVRAWADVTNISETTVGLEYVSSFAFVGLENTSPTVFIPHNAWFREVNWKEYSFSELGFDRTNSFSTKRVTASNTGTWATKEFLPMGAVSDANNTLMWQIESSGSWQWELSDIGNMLYIKLSGPTEQENMWYKELKSGEKFESVKACVTLANSFDGCLEHMTKYRRVIFENNKPNSALPVIFNDYMNCLFGDPTTEKLLPIIDKAAEAGAEYFCIDAGWYANGTWWDSVGEWMPSNWRFPGGIKEVFDRIHEKGMIPGIWLEIEVMGINCPILDRFDDDCFFMRHGKRVIDHSRYQLDFRNEKVRKFATSVIDRVVKEYGVGYIKLDYNIEAGMGTEVGSDSFGDGLLEHNRAYLKWIGGIKEKYPDLVLENCSSGGMRMEYSLLSRHHIQSVTDQTDYRHNAVIASNAATAVLPEQAAVWSYPKADGDENAAVFNMVSSMLLRIHLSGDVLHLSDKAFKEVKQGVECYKNIRSAIAQSIPFYPLGLNGYGKDFACAGYKTEDEKYIALWRLGTEENSVFIPSEAGNTAEIIYPANCKGSINVTDNGINVILPDKYSAVIIKTN